ncbi:MAG: FAD-binding oxidoreductase [Planctomycetes bacterium]|nr:FAD-binding oxidoreductase [Planctomycetota bacterium]
MFKSADIVIIGGGVFGTSVAYHLAQSGLPVPLRGTQAGAKNIILLEKDLLGSGATGKAAGLTIRQWTTELDIALVNGSLEIYKSLPGINSAFRQTGLVYLASTADDDKYLTQSELLIKTAGVRYSRWDKAAIKKNLPWMATDIFTAGLYTPDDGYIDPYQIVSAFASLARKKGVEFWEKTEAIAIDVSDNKVSGVKTSQGYISTPLIINAAGAWAKKVGALAGLNLPLKPYRTQIAVLCQSGATATERRMAVLKPKHKLPNNFTAVYDMAKNVYFHEETGGLLLAGDGTTETEENPDQYKQRGDDKFLSEIADKISSLIPGMSEAGVVKSWAGLCMATPDRLPVLGPVKELEGFWIAGGDNGYGFMRAGMLGKLLAEILRGDKSSLDISLLSPERFKGKDYSEFKIKQGMTV